MSAEGTILRSATGGDVRFHARNPVRAPKDNRTIFAFRKDRKNHRLQKKLFSKLRKLGAYAQQPAVVFNETVTYDSPKFFDVIRQSDIWHQMQGRRGVVLLVGNKTYFELMGQMQSDLGFSFFMHYQWCTGSDLSSLFRFSEIIGIKVVLVPYMEGLIVLNEKTVDLINEAQRV